MCAYTLVCMCVCVCVCVCVCRDRIFQAGGRGMALKEALMQDGDNTFTNHRVVFILEALFPDTQANFPF